MKVLRGIAIGLILFGLGLIILGTFLGISEIEKADERIYTTATIVDIDTYWDTPRKRYEYTTFVEFEVDGTKITRQLDSYKSTYDIGDKVDIYYFEDDMRMVHRKGGEYTLIILPIVGIGVIVVGFLMLFNKKTQNFFLK